MLKIHLICHVKYSHQKKKKKNPFTDEHKEMFGSDKC